MTAHPYPSLGRARFAQGVLFAIGLATTMDIYIVALLIEPMKHDLGLDDVQIGLATATAYYAAGGLLAAPMGMLVDRFDRVRLLQLAILFWCGGLALGALSHSLWLLSWGKAITGVGAAISYPAAMSLASDYFPPERRAFATMSYPVGQTLGGVCAMLAGGLGFAALTRIAAADPQGLLGVAPWRAVSLISAGAGLLLIPLLVLMHEPARQEVGDAANGGTFRELWSYRRILVPTLLAIMCLTGLGTSVMGWTAPVLTRVYDEQPGAFAGWLSATLIVSGLLSMLAAARLVNAAQRLRDGILRPAMWSAVALIPTCCMAIMPTIACFAIAFILFQLFLGIAICIAVISMNFRLPNELRGLAAGLQAVLAAVSSAAASPITAFIGMKLGGDRMIGQAMSIVGVSLASFAVLSLWAASRPSAPTARLTDWKEA